MRFIPTFPARVEQLQKQAKKLARNGGGKHVDLLDRVARSADYDHWHHVKLCLAQSQMASGAASLKNECAAIVEAELRGTVSVVMTGPETTRTLPLVLFSTGLGDAWLLDPDESLALCLLWHGARQSLEVEERPEGLVIAWDGPFELAGPFFKVDTRHEEIGVRAIGDYPLEELRQVIDKAQSTERKMAAVIFQDDAIELTPEVVDELVRNGWSKETIDEAVRRGDRYSPSRDSLLSKPVSGD